MYKIKKMSYKESVKAVKKLMEDARATRAASKIVQATSEMERRKSFDELKSALALHSKVGQRIYVMAKDGTVVCTDNSLDTFEKVASIKDHSGRLEVRLALDHVHCKKVRSLDLEEANRFTKSIQKHIIKGYGFEKRVSSSSGKLEKYVAIADVDEKEKFPYQGTFVMRVSNEQKAEKKLN